MELLCKGKELVDIVIELEVEPRLVRSVFHEWHGTPDGRMQWERAQAFLSQTVIHIISHDDELARDGRTVLWGLVRGEHDVHDSRRASCPSCMTIHRAIVESNQNESKRRDQGERGGDALN